MKATISSKQAARASQKFNTNKKMEHTFLGNEYTDDEIKKSMASLPYVRLDDATLISTVASLLEGTNVIGWFQGRMEFGQRSLGNRSIIADPRDPLMKDKINQLIKHREWYRPFEIG